MEDDLRDIVLKPIINRRRNHQTKRKPKAQPRTKRGDASEKTFSKQKYSSCQLGVNVVSLENLETHIRSLVEDRSMDKVVQLKEELLGRVKQILHPILEGDMTTADSWFNRLDREDVNQLLNDLDPMSIATSQVMSLPDTVTRMYSVSNLDILPTIYQRDHVWLCLQWSIDQVDNPFFSRECMSQPCLGNYVCGGENQTRPLPEMVPIRILERYMEYRAQGQTTAAFKDHLIKMRTDTKAVATNWCLARDVWSQPRCIICYMRDTFSEAADCSNVTRKEITLADYRKYFLVQFHGMRPDIMIDFEEFGFKFILKETGVLLPKLKIPLPSAIVSLLVRNDNGEISTDRLYV